MAAVNIDDEGDLKKRLLACLDECARDIATVKYTKRLVKMAEREFLRRVKNKTVEKRDYDAVITSENRYLAVVYWYQLFVKLPVPVLPSNLPLSGPTWGKRRS